MSLSVHSLNKVSMIYNICIHPENSYVLFSFWLSPDAVHAAVEPATSRSVAAAVGALV